MTKILLFISLIVSLLGGSACFPSKTPQLSKEILGVDSANYKKASVCKLYSDYLDIDSRANILWLKRQAMSGYFNTPMEEFKKIAILTELFFNKADEYLKINNFHSILFSKITEPEVSELSMNQYISKGVIDLLSTANESLKQIDWSKYASKLTIKIHAEFPNITRLDKEDRLVVLN